MPKLGGMPSMEGLEWGRLGMLAAGIVVVVLVLLLVARSCCGTSAESKNRDFFAQVQAVLKTSDAAGAAAPRPAPLAAAADVEERRQEADRDRGRRRSRRVTAATKLKPTKQVESLQPWLLQTLSYRVNGLALHGRALCRGAYKAKPVPGGKLLVPCTQRLLASDVIYTDSYAFAGRKDAAGRQHRRRGADLDVPRPSRTSDVVTPAGMGAVLQRWKPGSVAHGLHGLRLDTVVARAGDGKTDTMQVGTVNQVKITGLTFLVTATNGGDFTEFDVPVKITIGTGDSKIVKTATIAQIAKGQQQTVEITGFNERHARSSARR